MKGYTLHDTASSKVFYQTLDILKRHNHGIVEDKILEDVDGSLIFRSTCGADRVILKSEADVGIVCLEVDEGIALDGLDIIRAYDV